LCFMPISNLYRRQSAYFFDGDEGESIFLFFLFFFLFFFFFFLANSRNEYQEAQITDPDPDDGGMESYLRGDDPRITFMRLQ
jgi:hypothetical protein